MRYINKILKLNFPHEQNINVWNTQTKDAGVILSRYIIM